MASARNSRIPSLSVMVREAKPGLVYVGTSSGSGSGFIVDKKGYVVTNAHVVGGSPFVTLTFTDGQQSRGKVLGVDPSCDLALVQIEARLTRLVALPLADSDLVQVAEDVVALGYPLGEVLQGEPTVTRGIVSARREEGLQTDAAINPGNSGGPLLDTRGRVVGVNTARLGGLGISGIGMAVPSNVVKERLSFLAAGGVGLPAVPAVSFGEPRPSERGGGRRIHDVGRAGLSVALPRGWEQDSGSGNRVGFRFGRELFSLGLEAVSRKFDLKRRAKEVEARIKQQSRAWKDGGVSFFREGSGPLGRSFYIGYQGNWGDSRGTLSCLRVMGDLSSRSGSRHFLSADLSVPVRGSLDRKGLFQTAESLLEGFTLWDFYGSSRYGWSIGLLPGWKVEEFKEKSLAASSPESQGILMVQVEDMDDSFSVEDISLYAFQQHLRDFSDGTGRHEVLSVLEDDMDSHDWHRINFRYQDADLVYPTHCVLQVGRSRNKEYLARGIVSEPFAAARLGDLDHMLESFDFRG